MQGLDEDDDDTTTTTGNEKSAVKVYVQGTALPDENAQQVLDTRSSNRWIHLPTWPPPLRTMAAPLVLHFGRNTSLSVVDGASAVFDSTYGREDDDPAIHFDTYTYDPKNPTPCVGGASFNPTNSGVFDQGDFEQRDDVLVFTSAPVRSSVVIVGNIGLTVYVRSTAKFFDCVGRLCMVNSAGVSKNITDGMCRVIATSDEDSHISTSNPEHYNGQCTHVCPTNSDGICRVDFSIGSTAYRFLTGERIRLQFCSGAHPRWARNLGYNDPVATAVAMRSTEISVFRCSKYPSFINMPLFDTAAAAKKDK